MNWNSSGIIICSFKSFLCTNTIARLTTWIISSALKSFNNWELNFFHLFIFFWTYILLAAEVNTIKCSSHSTSASILWHFLCFSKCFEFVEAFAGFLNWSQWQYMHNLNLKSCWNSFSLLHQIALFVIFLEIRVYLREQVAHQAENISSFA